jgi:hypothetical protein
MTAGLALTCGDARKRHVEESKKETFWQLQRAQNRFVTSFHFPMKCVHMITTSSPLPSTNLATLRSR